ncbi:MAG: hypothetical protein U0704_03175 [Candidatus Eisenbacteria bacterium]
MALNRFRAALAFACLVASAVPAFAAVPAESDTSADGRQVVFVRPLEGRLLAAPSGDSLPASELVLANVAGGDERVLLVAGAKRHRNGSPVAGFWSPQFSPDGRTVWFTSPATVTSDIACALDLRTGALREACGANSLRVLERGPRAGCLIVEQHRYRKGGGAYDWLYLVDARGRTLQALGDPEDPRVKARVEKLVAGR